MKNLPRELTAEEAKCRDVILKEWLETGVCPHLCIDISTSDVPLFHGCIVCGRPIA